MTTDTSTRFPLKGGVYLSVSWNWAGSVTALTNSITGTWHGGDYELLMEAYGEDHGEAHMKRNWGPSRADSSIDLPALGGNLSEEALSFQVDLLHLMPHETERSHWHPPAQTVNSWANECCCFKLLSLGVVHDAAIYNWFFFYLPETSINGLQWQWGLESVWILCEFYHKHCQQHKSSDT